MLPYSSLVVYFFRLWFQIILSFRMGTSASSNIQHGEDIDSVIQTLNYTIVCGIEIKNSTKHTLHSPRTIVQWGFLLSPPSTAIKPGGKGHFVSLCKTCNKSFLGLRFVQRSIFPMLNLFIIIVQSWFKIIKTLLM